MSTIGSGPGIVTGAIEPLKNVTANAVRGNAAAPAPITASETASAVKGTASASATAGSVAAGPVVQTQATGAGEIPVDHDRVAAIKRAVQNGSYPVLPTRVGDAMIAAGFILSSKN